MKQCVLCVLGVLVCLAAQGLATEPESSLKDLENELDKSLKSAVNKVVSYIKKCDCFIRLDVLNARLDWYCSATSDYECQSLSLEELQDLVQTRAEAEGWKKKRLELLAQDVSRPKPCVCTVKVSTQSDTAVEYFCSDMSCYMLAAELSPKNTATAKISGWDRRPSCDDILHSDPDFKNNPCCRCLNPMRKPVCSSSHCPLPPCTLDKQEQLPGECCTSCGKASMQSIRANCPFYHENTWIMNTLSKCGCQLNCLKEKQEDCESRNW